MGNLNAPDRPLFQSLSDRQKGPTFNRFLKPIRDYSITDPQEIVKLVITGLKTEIQRRGTWNFASDVTPLRQVLHAVQGYPTDALALAREAVDYEQLAPEAKSRLKSERARAGMREFMASKPDTILQKPPTDKQLEYLRKLGVTKTPANRWEASQLIDAALQKGGQHA
ncbi:MAG: hypothetical protein M3361_08575 [Candidatus Tectomicrobia bacterium]|nr:hypothetical protein [Candidatus Tectomicrobia bacterium]